MSPRKRHHIESLEELSLVVVLSSVVADLHLAHLLCTDLQHSIVLSALNIQSPDELRKMVSARLATLPGLLNDQVRKREYYYYFFFLLLLNFSITICNF